MKIALITDLHIGTATDNTYGIDVRANFLNILQQVKQQEPDHLILLGDLCLTAGVQHIYEWIKEQLEELHMPYDIISGNHDDPVLLAKVFGYEEHLKQDRFYYSKKLGNRTAFFLDTTPRNLDTQQLTWLSEQLTATAGEVIIFMHHPPVIAGVPFMDLNHGLTNMEEIQAILFKANKIIPVFTGHYHAEKTVIHKNIILQITPSCYFQIGQTDPAFAVDYYDIALRIVTLDESDLKTNLIYTSGAKLPEG